MDYIKHTYTIQWVGPMDYDEYKEYLNNSETLSPEYFNFYYFEARKDARCKWNKYFGIHKLNDGINKRLKTSHEHLGPFIKEGAKDVRIWIGSFANPKDQKTKNIDIVETLFIKTYSFSLNINTKKKNMLSKESVCVINMYYNTNDEPIYTKTGKPRDFDDVIIYMEEIQSFKHGNLSIIRN